MKPTLLGVLVERCRVQILSQLITIRSSSLNKKIKYLGHWTPPLLWIRAGRWRWLLSRWGWSALKFWSEWRRDRRSGALLSLGLAAAASCLGVSTAAASKKSTSSLCLKLFLVLSVRDVLSF
eukprot:Blabericola_migrator_1__10958@NODE_633_length_7142_cov_112_965230_g464_i0_p8_GENE_NODE_633_length_7142_cov_112_965230_g464_i0NODE_633_length_7142_cov_112_965230_g464_i0_p8_ORF_typecomplete_len122_score12_61_NODE_633_length_7142_cov_112_965230_g464_i041834548